MKMMFKLLTVLLVLLSVVNVMAKKKDKIIIIGGGGGGGPGPMPYMHTTHSSPQIIPFPIPIYLPMQQQQSMMPAPIYLPPQMSTPHYSPPSYPTTQHIYHHHQNNQPQSSQPQIHFIQLPIYKMGSRERYGSEMQHYSTGGSSSGEQYQATDHYPIYSDYSYGSQSNVHQRRTGLEFNSIIPAHSFINKYNHQNHLNSLKYRKQLERMRKQKLVKKRKTKARPTNSSLIEKKTKKPPTNYKQDHLNHYVKYDDKADHLENLKNYEQKDKLRNYDKLKQTEQTHHLNGLRNEGHYGQNYEKTSFDPTRSNNEQISLNRDDLQKRQTKYSDK